MIPEDILQQEINKRTHLYLITEQGNLQDTKKHKEYIFTGLSYRIQREKVASRTFFPTDKSSHSHTCS